MKKGAIIFLFVTILLISSVTAFSFPEFFNKLFSKPQLGPSENSIYDFLNQMQGFAKVAETTGGKDGKIYYVTNLNDNGDGSLRKAIESKEKLWIVFNISGKINLKDELWVRSDKTIDGRGQKIIINKPMRLYSKADYGYASENVIIENIIFENTDKDSITAKYKTKKVWIDHCTFYDSGSGEHDGLIDITRGSTDITISWNKFSKHIKTILIGHDDGNGKEDKNIRITMHNNFFDGTGQRHPRLRFGKVHAFNNYLYKWKGGSDGKAFGMGSACDGEIYSEKNIFEADKDKDAIVTSGSDLGSSPSGKAKSTGDLFLNGAKAKTKSPDDVFNPSDYYSYDAQEANDELKNLIKEKSGWQNVPLPPIKIIEKNDSKNICNSNGICDGTETPSNCQSDCQCNINEDCQNNNLCATKTCQNHKCIITNNSNNCNDNNACTINDICSQGKCGGTAKDCNDNLSCTTDSCQNGICIHTALNCVCQFNTDCEDGNVCTDNSCVNDSCISSPNAQTCDDGDKTTADDKCSDNKCVGENMRPKNTKFKNSISTNTEAITDLSNVKNFRLGIPNKALIKFSKAVNLSEIDLDEIKIENGSVSIDSEDLPTLNVSAEIVFYKVEFKNPIVLKDGKPCEECKIISKTGSTIIVSVSHFTTYTLAEGSYCGDKICQSGENCTSCNSDCGTCSNPVVQKCVSKWKCEIWSECDETEIQTRTCTDLNSCSNETNQKDEEKSCDYIDDTQNTETPTTTKSETNWILISLIVGMILILIIVFFATYGSEILEKLRKRK